MTSTPALADRRRLPLVQEVAIGRTTQLGKKLDEGCSEVAETVWRRPRAPMFYAPDASDRVMALFRSFGGAEAVSPASEA